MEKREDTSVSTISSVKTDQFWDKIIQKCIQNLELLLEQYPNEGDMQQLLELKNKYKDPVLKLAVIGEFNTGKSTFINALLRQDYLSTDNIPTTVIPTYIRWTGKPNTKPDVTVTLASDSYKYNISRDRQLLEKKLGIHLGQENDLERITTNNDLIGVVSHVSVSFPEEYRFKDFCLIDTPGANPGAEETKEHANITRKVLREEADATIILFPSHTAGNRSALEFISENASHLLEGAAFVITKADMIDSEREMNKIVQYLKGLVKQRYSLEDQPIYTCSAKRALQALEENNATEPYLLQFNDIVDRILKDIESKRRQIIMKKVSALISTVLKGLHQKQTHLSETLKEDMELLELYSLENLQKEFMKRYQRFDKDLEAKCKERNNQIRSKLRRRRESANAGVELDLHFVNGIGELRTFAEEGIRERLDDFERDIKCDIKDDVKSMERLYSAFSKDVFKQLQHYQLKISSQIAKGKNISAEVTAPSVVLDVSIDGIIGGLGLGALILLFVNPAGLLALLAVGWMFSDAILSRMKERIRGKVANGLEEACDTVAGKWTAVLNNTKASYLTSGKNLMADYKNKYATVFQNRKQEDKKRHQELRRAQKKVNDSLQLIDAMERVLEMPGMLNSYEEIDNMLIEQSIGGDASAVGEIVEQYRRLASSTGSEKHQQQYQQWLACRELLDKNDGLC